MMFSFFGLFTDPLAGLPMEISAVWPDLNVTKIEKPIAAIAVRFGREQYQPENEDVPLPIVRATESLSGNNPSARFLLLRTECWGGLCANWGLIIQNGRETFRAQGDGALRRVVMQWGVDIGPYEIFEPLRRTFAWD